MWFELELQAQVRETWSLAVGWLSKHLIRSWNRETRGVFRLFSNVDLRNQVRENLTRLHMLGSS